MVDLRSKYTLTEAAGQTCALSSGTCEFLALQQSTRLQFFS